MAIKEIVWAAVSGGNLVLVKSLLDEEGSLLSQKDEKGCTLLHIAAEGDYRDIAQMLLERGAAVNEPDEHGYRALHCVKSKAMAELLITKGADVNAKDNYGLIPLHNAVLDGHGDIVELYILNGANINAVENKGFTPLKMAVRYKLPEIEALLRKYGATE